MVIIRIIYDLLLLLLWVTMVANIWTCVLRYGHVFLCFTETWEALVLLFC